jgi:zinc/manganese transport system substrate-binding protein
MMNRTPSARRLGFAAIAVTLLAGCASPANGQADAGGLSIVASTSVYGSLAQAVVGQFGDVTSIIVRGNQDPHGYEATARDQLTLSRADLVIQNGGGYDPFVGELLETSGNQPVVLTAVADDVAQAVEEHGEHSQHDGEAHEHAHGENEHVWYSLHAMHDFAGRLGDALAALEPARAGTYRANAERLLAGIEALQARAAELSAAGAGVTALATEPVPLPLLADLGIEDRTPVEFLAALEDGRDVPPGVLDETLDLIAGGGVGLVAFNEQTVDATSTLVVEVAAEAGVPVVSFSELPPEGSGYLEWMTVNLDRLAEVLG